MKCRSLKRLREALDFLNSYYPPSKLCKEREIMLKSRHSVADGSCEGLWLHYWLSLRGEGETEREFSMLCLVLRTFFINALVIVSRETKFCVHVFLIDLVAVEKGVWKCRIVRKSVHSSKWTFIVRLLQFFSKQFFLYLVGMRVRSVSIEQTNCVDEVGSIM